MPLKLFKRGNTFYLRGSVRGIPVYESTKTSDEDAADVVRIATEWRVLQESIFGKKAIKTFQEACSSYMASGGSQRFLAALTSELGTLKLYEIQQSDLDVAARKIFPDTQPETRNRQFYTPFIAVWNHAVKNGWAELRMWQRPRKPKGTRVVRSVARTGTKPVEYERAAMFVGAMSPSPGHADDSAILYRASADRTVCARGR